MVDKQYNSYFYWQNIISTPLSLHKKNEVDDNYVNKLYALYKAIRCRY